MKLNAAAAFQMMLAARMSLAGTNTISHTQIEARKWMQTSPQDVKLVTPLIGEQIALNRIPPVDAWWHLVDEPPE